MIKILLLILTINILYLYIGKKAYSQSNDSLRMKIDSIANVYISDTLNSGLTIGLFRKGAKPNSPPVKETYYYGEVRKGSGIKPDSLTIFKLASIGKTLTATILAYYVMHDPLNVKLDGSYQQVFSNRSKAPLLAS